MGYDVMHPLLLWIFIVFSFSTDCLIELLPQSCEVGFIFPIEQMRRQRLRVWVSKFKPWLTCHLIQECFLFTCQSLPGDNGSSWAGADCTEFGSPTP